VASERKLLHMIRWIPIRMAHLRKLYAKLPAQIEKLEPLCGQETARQRTAQRLRNELVHMRHEIRRAIPEMEAELVHALACVGALRQINTMATGEPLDLSDVFAVDESLTASVCARMAELLPTSESYMPRYENAPSAHEIVLARYRMSMNAELSLSPTYH
jgi:hypothetical protein